MATGLKQRQQPADVSAAPKQSPSKGGVKRKVKGPVREHSRAPYISAVCLVLYYFCMMVTRFFHRGTYAFLDTAWLCNFNLLLAAAGMVLSMPALIGACLTAVFVVHSLWIVDVITWLSTGSFPVGLAAYVAWPETTWGEIITSTHHVWFSPLCLYIMYKLRGKYAIKSWLISGAFILPVTLSSLFIPEEIILENGEPYYLNINMAHGWWKDVNKWPFSLIPPGKSTEYMIFLNCFVFTKFTIAFLVLKIVTKFVLKEKKN